MRGVGANTAAIVLAAGLLVGCSHHHAAQDAPHPTTTTTVLPEAPPIVHYAAPALPASFNPLTPGGDTPATHQVMVRVWPSVFLITPQYAPEADTAFVTSAELISVDPQTVEYRINPKATWSDGVPISVDDFVFNWHAQSGDPAYTDVGGVPFDVVSTLGYSDIASVTGTNSGKTVTVVLRQPFSEWESLFSPLVPAHIARKIGWNHGFDHFDPATVISGGPFTVTGVTAQGVTLGRNPAYWAAPAGVAGINFDLMVDPSAYPAALAGGSVQLANARADVDYLQKVSGIPDVLRQPGGGGGLNFEEIDFNEKNPNLADVLVREAIANFTDRAALVAASFGQFQQDILPDDNHIYVNNQPQSLPNGSGYDAPDAALGTKELDQAGYVLGADAMWHAGSPAGPVLSFRYTTEGGDSLRQIIAQVFQTEMRTAGIAVTIVNDSPTQLTADLLGGNYDIAELAHTASPYASVMEPIYSVPPGADVNGAAAHNYLYYSNATVNQLFGQAIETPDPFHAAESYNAIDKILWDDMASLPLCEDPEYILYSDRLEGVIHNPSVSTTFWNAETWHLLPPRVAGSAGSGSGAEPPPSSVVSAR